MFQRACRKRAGTVSLNFTLIQSHVIFNYAIYNNIKYKTHIQKENSFKIQEHSKRILSPYSNEHSLSQ